MDCGEEFRDPQRAVELARKAVELRPVSAWSWRVLGLAHYQAGNWQPSIEAHEKSLDNKPDALRRVRTWLYLAMAHAHLGNSEEARGWSEKATNWYADNDVDGGLRAQAAALLESKEKTQPKAHSK